MARETAPRSVLAAMRGMSVDAVSLVFEAAQRRRDLGTLDRMLSPTYVFVHGSGKVGDRRDFLAALSDLAEVFTALNIVNRKLIPVGREGAIVAAEVTVHGGRNRIPFIQHFHYDDPYVNTRGIWEVVYTKVTALPP